MKPRFVALADPTKLYELREGLAGSGVLAGAGEEALEEAAQRDADWVHVRHRRRGRHGPDSRRRTPWRDRGAGQQGKASFCGGRLLIEAAARHGARLIPVDSEHNAIFQVLGPAEGVEKVTLTASGGPFRSWARDAMVNVTPDQACKHPNWSMGKKNSIDSATLMNKGLEVIEAAYLFDLPPAKLDVLVHPQSIVHALVAYCDGSVLAQLAAPDMRTPIAHALAWPGRASVSTPRLDLARAADLSFEAPNYERFPALGLARAALEAGGLAPAILNAANEIAVAAFLERRIGFLDIAGIVEAVLNRLGSESTSANSPSSLDEVLAIDALGRRWAGQETSGGRLPRSVRENDYRLA